VEAAAGAVAVQRQLLAEAAQNGQCALEQLRGGTEISASR
jgi:hypothetical protein